MNKKYKDNTLDEIYGKPNTSAPAPNGNLDPDWNSILMKIAFATICVVIIVHQTKKTMGNIQLQMKKELDAAKKDLALKMEEQKKEIAQKIEESVVAPAKKEEPPQS